VAADELRGEINLHVLRRPALLEAYGLASPGKVRSVTGGQLVPGASNFRAPTRSGQQPRPSPQAVPRRLFTCVWVPQGDGGSYPRAHSAVSGIRARCAAAGIRGYWARKWRFRIASRTVNWRRG
jgi:hypothetical protein